MKPRSEADKMADLIAKDAADIVELLKQSQNAQWEASRSTPAGEGSRPRGTHGDPTASVALDPRRLAVRESREEALTQLVKAYDGLSRARTNLISALEKWRA